ncbi:nucleoside phosphorylase, partial [Xylogone sp. PMI_703]
MPEPTIEDYTIGWICALQEEYEAACRMLDVEFDGPETSEVNDNNTYAFGCVSRHNVVIGCLPNGRYGTSSAARVARDMVRSFPNLRFALMVGIGGGAPTRERDIRLGDVVVSVPQDGLGGVVQYDFGKRLSDGRFQRTSQLNAPPEVLLGVIPEMQRRHNDPRKPDRISEHLKLMGDMPGYQRPPDDRLYRADYEHKGGKNCTSCKADGLEERLPRESSREVAIHHGIIASANSVMKNAKERDKYAQDPELNILCFEMEAGGLMNNFPCLVIRGICDYSDSHKNDDWHKYAALTAAAYARELLHILKPRRVTIMPSWVEKMEISKALADIQGQVSATFRKTDQIIHRQRTQEHKEILNWLTEIDYGPQQSDYIGRRQARTGQWLLGSAEFQAWLQDSRQTLFCPGIPGAGKTMITSIVVDFLETNFPKGSNVGIVYFYCNFRRQHEQTLEHFRMSLLKQLLQGQPSMPDSMKQLHNHHKEKQTRPSSNEIFTVLQSVTTIYTRIFIIIDALDECAAGRCRNTLLSEIFNLQSKSAISIFATSRISDEISKSFDGALRLIIHATNEDLETYLKGRMVLQQPDIFDDNIQEMAVAGIIKAADGMFLLAELHMNTLLSLPTKGDIKQALRSLAKGVGGLDETYELAMQRIESQGEGYRKLAKQTLAWIVHAKRSLSTLELRHALAVRPCIKYFDGDYIPTATVVRSVCAGLVTVDEESNIIRLVHYTTQEYFEKTQGMWFPDAIADIAVICTTYLSYSIFESGVCRTNKEFKERLRSNQLYDYAARNWGHHAMEIADEKAQVKVLELILDLLSNEAMVSGCSQAMM